MRKEDKQKSIDELKEIFGGANAVFVTHYRGLTVKQSNKLRRALQEIGAGYTVAKNTLLTIASKGTDYETLGDDFVGPVGIVSVKGDPAQAAKIVCEFAKSNDKFVIISGAISGKRFDAAGVDALSKLPSRDQMLGMLVGVMAGPMRNLVGVLAGVPRSFLQVLKSIEEKKAA